MSKKTQSVEKLAIVDFRHRQAESIPEVTIVAAGTSSATLAAENSEQRRTAPLPQRERERRKSIGGSGQFSHEEIRALKELLAPFLAGKPLIVPGSQEPQPSSLSRDAALPTERLSRAGSQSVEPLPPSANGVYALIEQLHQAIQPSDPRQVGAAVPFVPQAALARQLSDEDAAALVRAEHDEMFRRIPLGADKKLNRAAEHCPHSGLNRNQIYDLLKLQENGKYVIDRAPLGKKGKSRGVVMYNVGSVLRYLKRLAKEQAVEAAKA